MDGCIFCKIASGEIPAQLLYEDARVAAFNDLNPQAPVHVLIVPKAHYANILECMNADIELLGDCAKAAAIVAQRLGVDKTGFRLLTNCGPQAGQTVEHLHFHLLAGKQLSDHMA